MRRMAHLAGAAGLAVVLVSGLGAGPASAQAPDQAGWWTSASSGGLPGSAPQPPSDVPAKGLLIEGGPSSASGSSDSGATAFAAVVYEIPQGATVGKLTLNVASNSATTPVAQLELCPLTTPTIQSEYGGSSKDAPAYSCKQNVTAGPSSSGKSYTWNAAKLVSGGTLAVAILPTSVIDRVVFDAPDSNSLAVTGGFSDPSVGNSLASGTVDPGSSTTGAATATSPSAAGSSLSSGSSGASVAAGGTAAPGEAVSAAPVAGSSTTPSAGSSPALATTQTRSSGASSSPTSAAQQGSASSPVDSQFAASTSGSSKANPLAVGLLIAAILLGGGIWLAVGRAASSAAGGAGADPTPT